MKELLIMGGFAALGGIVKSLANKEKKVINFAVNALTSGFTGIIVYCSLIGYVPENLLAASCGFSGYLGVQIFDSIGETIKNKINNKIKRL